MSIWCGSRHWFILTIMLVGCVIVTNFSYLLLFHRRSFFLINHHFLVIVMFCLLLFFVFVTHLMTSSLVSFHRWSVGIVCLFVVTPVCCVNVFGNRPKFRWFCMNTAVSCGSLNFSSFQSHRFWCMSAKNILHCLANVATRLSAHHLDWFSIFCLPLSPVFSRENNILYRLVPEFDRNFQGGNKKQAR